MSFNARYNAFDCHQWPLANETVEEIRERNVWQPDRTCNAVINLVLTQRIYPTLLGSSPT